jgi:hypothetical protein
LNGAGTSRRLSRTSVAERLEVPQIIEGATTDLHGARTYSTAIPIGERSGGQAKEPGGVFSGQPAIRQDPNSDLIDLHLQLQGFTDDFP